MLVTTEPVDQAGPGGIFEATRARATNKLLYAADVPLPTAGRWRLRVETRGEAGAGEVAFEAEVAEAGPLDSPLTLALLAALGVAALGWLLARGRGRPGHRPGAGRPDARPG